MDYLELQRQFNSEYHRRLIASHIMGMKKKDLPFVAMYYFGFARAELAYRMAKMLAGDHDRVTRFLKCFPLSDGDLIRVNHSILEQSIGKTSIREAKTKDRHDKDSIIPA